MTALTEPMCYQEGAATFDKRLSYSNRINVITRIIRRCRELVDRARLKRVDPERAVSSNLTRRTKI